jgi:hypothetical protein
MSDSRKIIVMVLAALVAMSLLVLANDRLKHRDRNASPAAGTATVETAPGLAGAATSRLNG